MQKFQLVDESNLAFICTWRHQMEELIIKRFLDHGGSALVNRSIHRVPNLMVLLTRRWSRLEGLAGSCVCLFYPWSFPFPSTSASWLLCIKQISASHSYHPDALTHLRPKVRSWLTTKPLRAYQNKPLLP